MRRKKESLLIKHKAGVVKQCVCMSVLQLKREILSTDLHWKKEGLKKQIVGSVRWQQQLEKVVRIGCKLKAIKDAIQEIETSNEIINNMIVIEINGARVPRLNNNSDRKRSCTRKAANTQREAESIAKSMTDRIENEAFEAYKCRYCAHWHVGHSVRDFLSM